MAKNRQGTPGKRKKSTTTQIPKKTRKKGMKKKS